MTYKVIALARLVCPRANIPSTTALATLNRRNGRELGLVRGANVVMPNLTPPKYRVHLRDLSRTRPASARPAERVPRAASRRGSQSIGRSVGAGPRRFAELRSAISRPQRIDVQRRVSRDVDERCIDVVCDRQAEAQPQRLRLHRRGRICTACWTGRPTPAEVRDVIAKSLAKQPLTVEETAVLLAADEPELVEEIFDAARQLKRDVYGNRIVLFAPLYIGNECTNDCHVLRVPPLEPRGGPPHAGRGRNSASRSRPWSSRATSG